MSLHSMETQPWVWIDPRFHLKHCIVKRVFGTPHGVDTVDYVTYCGYSATVDDINPRTQVVGMPTCVRCIVAVPPLDVIPTEE